MHLSSALRPAGAWARRTPLSTAAGLIGTSLLVAGCGGSGTTSATVTPGSATSSSSTAVAASPSPTAATTSDSATTTTASTSAGGPGIALLWSVNTTAGVVLRQATPGGGPAHTVATLGSSDFLLDAGHGRAVFANMGARHFDVVDVGSGAVSTLGTFTDTALTGALSPDGGRLAFIDAGPASALKVLDLGAGTVSTIRTYASSPVDAPTVWAADGLGCILIVPNSDAGPQGVTRVDPGTGGRVATTAPVGAASETPTADALHGFATTHSALGDDADAVSGPGPQGPFNTLVGFTIGATPTTILSEAHHNISGLATLPAGDAVLISDEPAAGGFAGISMSPSFGLIVQRGPGRTQYRTYDGTQYDNGVFFQDGTTVAASSHDSSNSKLQQYTPGGTPILLDTVAGGTGSRVLLVPA